MPTPDLPARPDSTLPEKASSALRLSESAESQRRFDAMLLGCFTVQRLYGKDAGSLEAISEVFHAVLGKYPANRVLTALTAWIEASGDFPTPHDLITLIKRPNGPANAKEVYISLQRTPPEQRTPEQWRYIRAYEDEQMQALSTDDAPDDTSVQAWRQEVSRLRTALAERDAEISRLRTLLAADRAEIAALDARSIPLDQRIQATIDMLRETGGEEAVAEFLREAAG